MHRGGVGGEVVARGVETVLCFAEYDTLAHSGKLYTSIRRIALLNFLSTLSNYPSGATSKSIVIQVLYRKTAASFDANALMGPYSRDTSRPKNLAFIQSIITSTRFLAIFHQHHHITSGNGRGKATYC